MKLTKKKKKDLIVNFDYGSLYDRVMSFAMSGACNLNSVEADVPILPVITPTRSIREIEDMISRLNNFKQESGFKPFIIDHLSLITNETNKNISTHETV